MACLIVFIKIICVYVYKNEKIYIYTNLKKIVKIKSNTIVKEPVSIVHLSMLKLCTFS